ncbi:MULTISPECIES: hypothetical protein [unclassified Actinobaculum]|uniref:hypothetical protein n=1 Tax=unclassified Actinobaculum TaxID=2609299 RepID=UPI000D527CD3|nr:MULTISPECIES: hypothetical protein [unclassified Actinobaculum]AWE43193.1 hypothetical protein DDD63_11060 [Actinobaculum sp. 313]RTE49906.1 hypothetical protein EKN07_05160 [Actinobaculum sp. 352]
MSESYAEQSNAAGAFPDQPRGGDAFADRPNNTGSFSSGSRDGWDAASGSGRGSMPRYGEPSGRSYSQAPYPNAQHPYPYEHDKTLTVVGLVLAFFIPLASIIIAVLQLSELNRSNAVNRDTLVRMNKATLWINAVVMFLAVIVALAIMSAA